MHVSDEYLRPNQRLQYCTECVYPLQSSRPPQPLQDDNMIMNLAED